MRNLTSNVTAYAQVFITVAFLCGYFVLLWDFVHGHVAIPVEWKEQIKTLLDILTLSVTQVIYFWFSRHRAASGNT